MRSFLLSLTVCLLFACKKDKLSPLSMTGAGTFSCKINGKVYLGKSKQKKKNPVFAAYDEPSQWLQVWGFDNTEEPGWDINFELHQYTGVGKWVGNGQIFFRCNIDNKTYLGDIGVVLITKHDLNTAILSGSFSFEATNTQNPSDKIIVSDGRFDVDYFN